jgi:hypothetical protein
LFLRIESNICMKTWLVCLGFLLLPLLAACGQVPELRDMTLLQDESLISKEPCAAPCWRGIVPGETLWRDALTILEDDELLENVELQQQEEGQVGAVALFRGVGGQVQCCNLLTVEGQVVDIITLRPAPTMTLGEVIEAWDEPAYAVGEPLSDNQALLYTLYPDVPMMVAVFAEGANSAVSATSEIVGIWYMTADRMTELVTASPLHIWEGYDTFQAYSIESETFDITPAPTATPEAGDGSG